MKQRHAFEKTFPILKAGLFRLSGAFMPLVLLAKKSNRMSEIGMFNTKYRRKRDCEMMRPATVFLAAILSCMAITGPAVAQSGSESSGTPMNSFVIQSYSDDITKDSEIISEIEVAVNRILHEAWQNLADAPDFLEDSTGKIPLLQKIEVHLKTEDRQGTYKDEVDDAIAWVYPFLYPETIYFGRKSIDMLHKASAAEKSSSLREQTVAYWAQVIVHEIVHLIRVLDECETTRHELLFVTNSSYREHVFQNGYVRECGLSAMLPVRMPPPDLTERDPADDFLITLMLTLLYNDESENSIALLLNALTGGLSGDLIGLTMSAVDGSASDDLVGLLLAALDDDLSEGLTGLLLSAVDDNTPAELTGMIEDADSGVSAEETPPPMSEEDLKKAEDALGLTRAERRQIQNGLNKLGFEAGPADGIFGNKTRQAIRSWQQANGSQSTGYLNQSEADVLVEEGKDMASDNERTVADEANGSTFRDCGSCPEMVVVPGGSFTMGSPASEEGRRDREGPQHQVSIEKFAVGKYEVTFNEWDACVSEGGCGGYRPDDEGWGRGNRPVIYVSWDNAKSYVEWLSRRTGHQYRLLSESEWEYAARAGTKGPFHFGSTISTDQANYDGDYTYGNGRKGVYRGETTPVGSFPSNGFGLHDMHGNVLEWVEDCWHDSYAGAPNDGSAWTSGGNCGGRVLRGGSWYDSPWGLRSADRVGKGSGYRNVNDGFRVARTLTP